MYEAPVPASVHVLRCGNSENMQNSQIWQFIGHAKWKGSIHITVKGQIEGTETVHATLPNALWAQSVFQSLSFQTLYSGMSVENVPAVVNIKPLKGRFIAHKWTVGAVTSVEKNTSFSGQFAVQYSPPGPREPSYHEIPNPSAQKQKQQHQNNSRLLCSCAYWWRLLRAKIFINAAHIAVAEQQQQQQQQVAGVALEAVGTHKSSSTSLLQQSCPSLVQSNKIFIEVE